MGLAKRMIMKLAIVGKGGVGKTTLAAALAARSARLGRPVVAVDADPDGNLASALGLPPERTPPPIVQMRELIVDRTGARDDGAGLMFRMNPEVEDLLPRLSAEIDGVRLLVLGTVPSGGKGCMCPESAVLKALMQHLLLRIPDEVILDMEAGLEHLGRASARGVDAMITVVEPGMRSIQTAERVHKLAAEIGIRFTPVVANKITQAEQVAAIEEALRGQTVLGALPYRAALAQADWEGRPADWRDPALQAALDRICEALASHLGVGQAVAP